jgi:hypothetical protein
MKPLNFILNVATEVYIEWNHSTLYWMQPLNFILNVATEVYIEW